MGLSINSKQIYCGDSIFSGHATILILGYLIIKECKFSQILEVRSINLTFCFRHTKETQSSSRPRDAQRCHSNCLPTHGSRALHNRCCRRLLHHHKTVLVLSCSLSMHESIEQELSEARMVDAIIPLLWKELVSNDNQWIWISMAIDLTV